MKPYNSFSILFTHELVRLIPLISATFLSSILPNLCNAIPESLSTDSSESQKAHRIYSITFNSIIENQRPFPKELEKNPHIFTKYIGIKYGSDSENPFHNSVLTEMAVFHHNEALNKILDKCNFKTHPQITIETLSHKDINGVNLLGHAIRNRIAMGNKLSNRIIDIYIDNLDKNDLLKNLNEFVLTLPTKQFKKILSKVGAQSMKDFLESKTIDQSRIDEVLAQNYHSPEVLIPKKIKGDETSDMYQHSTVTKGSSKNPDDIKKLILQGFHVQITKKMYQQIRDGEDGENFLKNRQNIYLTPVGTVNGIIATQKTLDVLTKNGDPEEVKEFLKCFYTKSASQELTENLEKNKKFLAKKLEKPSPEPNAPSATKTHKQKSQSEL